VHKSMRDLELTWQLTHELWLLYLRDIEMDVTKTLNFANCVRPRQN
jgi:hypothetical protein